MDIPESTPIKCKIKLPFNGTAIMRITEVQFVAVSKHLTASINTTTLISSANDDINDICWIDLGNVTRGSSENGTQIKIEFEVQVMNHAHIVNRDVQWVSVGVQYINQSVWASQLGIKIIYPGRVKKPDLKFSFWADIGGFSIIARYVCLKHHLFSEKKKIYIYIKNHNERVFSASILLVNSHKLNSPYTPPLKLAKKLFRHPCTLSLVYEILTHGLIFLYLSK